MRTVEGFRENFTKLTEAVISEYGKDTEVCEVMHQDLGFGQTPRDDAEELATTIREESKGKVDIPADSIKFTEEHTALHEFLRRAQFEAQYAGLGPQQLAATFFVVGRRMGLQEAAQLLSGGDEGSSDDNPDTL